MLRSIAELAVYGTFAALLTAASLATQSESTASSAPAGNGAAAAPGLTVSTDRGALLFATKGCVGCHTHTSLPNSHMQVGPDLTALAGRAATRIPGLDARGYVRQSLRDPRGFLVAGYEAQMPDLKLTDEEIESLSAFLLAPAR
jgi:cytochrome c551/c552